MRVKSGGSKPAAQKKTLKQRASKTKKRIVLATKLAAVTAVGGAVAMTVVQGPASAFDTVTRFPGQAIDAVQDGIHHAIDLRDGVYAKGEATYDYVQRNFIDNTAEEKLSTLNGLSPEQKAEYNEILAHEGDSRHPRLLSLIEKAYRQPDATQTVLFQQGIRVETPAAQAHFQVIESKVWEEGSQADREALVKLLQNAPEASLLELGAVAQAKPEVLLASAPGESTVVIRLADLTTQTPNEALTRAVADVNGTLLNTLLTELRTEGRSIQQSTFGTCTVTSFQRQAPRAAPGPYVDVLVKLASEKGEASIAPDLTLAVQPEHLLQLAQDGRSITGLIFQAAAMEAANGADVYNASTDQSTRPDGSTYGGLAVNDFARFATAMLGKTYEAANAEPSRPSHLVDYLAFHDPATGPVFLSIEKADGTGGHAIALDKVQGGRIFVENTWSTEGAQSFADTYGAKVEDPENQIFSFSPQVFSERLTAVVSPSDEYDIFTS